MIQEILFKIMFGIVLLSIFFAPMVLLYENIFGAKKKPLK